MQIDLLAFTGIAPRLDEHKLAPENAVYANNCRIKNGNLESWHTLTPVSATLQSGLNQSIFLYEDVHWFSWNNIVDAILSPIANDSYKRVYFMGDGVPKVTSNLIGTGTDPKPSASYTLGVQAPTLPVTAVVDNTGSDPDDPSDDETRFYFMTYVTEYGEEGPPGPISLEQTILSPGNPVLLTLPNPATNTENITHKRIYRTTTSGSFTDGFRVATVALATATYNDLLVGAQLGSPSDTLDFVGPPSDAKGLVQAANGIAVCFSGNEVLFSEAYLPYAFKTENRTPVAFDVVGIAPTERGVVVGTKGKPVFFSGITPDAMTPNQIDLMQACSSQRSMVDMGGYVLYASPDGIVRVSESEGAVLISESLFTKQQWKNYNPETIHAYRYENQYIGFYGDINQTGSGVGGFIYDPRVQSFTTIDSYATAAHHDIESDTLYMVIDGQIYAWDSGNDNLLYRYKSKVFRTPFLAFSCYRAYTQDPARAGFALYRNGVKVWEENALQDEIGRVPGDQLGNRWQIELFGRAPIERFVLATSTSELKA